MHGQAGGVCCYVTGFFFHQSMLFFDELLFENFVDFVWDLLAAAEGEDVLSEGLQRLLEHVQRQ